jgi:hypothetical protein
LAALPSPLTFNTGLALALVLFRVRLPGIVTFWLESQPRRLKVEV